MVAAPPPRAIGGLATSETSRARRFSLPDLGDERAEESIEAFVHGRRRRGAMPGVGPARSISPQGTASGMRVMPGRLEWQAAIERETARASRYDRPAAVVVIELRPLRATAAVDSSIRVHAAPVGAVLLRQTRETDVVARVARDRFQVLLPETTAVAAGEFVDRIVAECQEQLRAVGAPLRIAASVAAAGPDRPLRDAVSQALRSIEAA